MSAMTGLGSWLLVRVGRGVYAEAVAGDLMEGVRGGRSAGWYWRQVVGAIAVAWVSRLRGRAGAVVFSVMWAATGSLWWYWRPSREVFSMIFSVAQRSTDGMFPHLLSLPFPYSWMSLALWGERVNVSFVCLGLLAYLTVSRRGWRGSSMRRLGGGLMMCSSVYLLGMFMLWAVWGYPHMGHPHVIGAVEGNLIWLWCGLSIAGSVYCGIVMARPERVGRLGVAA